jgi:type IV secretion system protein VirB9
MKGPVLLLVALMAAPCLAQIEPRPTGGDPRIQSLPWAPDQVFRIRAAQGYQVTLQLAPDERIENVAVGDSAAWQVSANNRGDLLFIKPIRDGVTTNLTVATDVRLYLFELAPADGAGFGSAYLVRFEFPAIVETPVETDRAAMQGTYRLSGARALRPSWIGDDGVRTYIEWPDDAALPAVFTLDRHGREALVNGHMRDGRYVIDSVLPKLLFRIDGSVARATRRAPRNAG